MGGLVHPCLKHENSIVDPIYLNAAVFPLMATMFIPDAIRDRKSGEYKGLLNKTVVAYAIAVFAIEGFFTIDKFGFSFTTILRVIGVSLMPFIGGYVFVKYSHKQLFGEEFDPKNKKGG